MDYTGIPTPQLEVAPMAKKDDLLVGSQDGKSRNFRVEDIRGINDNKKGKDTTYSSEQIEKLIATLTSLSDGDITVVVNAISELNNTVNSNKEEVNKELENRYKKDETFSKEEVLQKIADLVNSAPETLDTLEEIARALGNDPNFSTTIINSLAGKVDKEEGKGLSTNDYTDIEKHTNKALLDSLIDNGNGSMFLSDNGTYKDAVEDTGWVNLTLFDGFMAREGYEPQIRRIGKIVFIRGQIKTDGWTSGWALQIPEGFRSSKTVQKTSLIEAKYGVDMWYVPDESYMSYVKISLSQTLVDKNVILDDLGPWLIE